jgi:hypothetical protein
VAIVTKTQNALAIIRVDARTKYKKLYLDILKIGQTRINTRLLFSGA